MTTGLDFKIGQNYRRDTDDFNKHFAECKNNDRLSLLKDSETPYQCINCDKCLPFRF